MNTPIARSALLLTGTLLLVASTLYPIGPPAVSQVLLAMVAGVCFLGFALLKRRLTAEQPDTRSRVEPKRIWLFIVIAALISIVSFFIPVRQPPLSMPSHLLVCVISLILSLGVIWLSSRLTLSKRSRISIILVVVALICLALSLIFKK